MKERVVNLINRAIITERECSRGLWYQSCSAGRRYDIYKFVFDRYAQGPIDYLEFGVYRGDSIKFALEKLGTGCNFYGFDSFEGLPEDWFYGVGKGTFWIPNSPTIMNPSVRIIKGRFEDSLEPFLRSVTLRDKLIIHMDADLYSSTIYALRTLRDYIVPGVVILFDEYWFVMDEFRALQEFVNETGKQFEYVAITETRAAVRFV